MGLIVLGRSARYGVELRVHNLRFGVAVRSGRLIQRVARNGDRRFVPGAVPDPHSTVPTCVGAYGQCDLWLAARSDGLRMQASPPSSIRVTHQAGQGTQSNARRARPKALSRNRLGSSAAEYVVGVLVPRSVLVAASVLIVDGVLVAAERLLHVVGGHPSIRREGHE